MTYVNTGSFVTQPGHRDAVVAILTRHSPQLAASGCLSYEVGVDEDHPDTVFVAETWTSASAHEQSLQLESTREAIAEAMPLLTGEMTQQHFTSVGSPLQD
ncbi:MULTISPECIES: putative quinol monooxygenase [Nesterenkonia]|uniref:Quinol monooxygenase YgiN n=1 Tax=Nesterenkonia xinjiangensis TaxID=225327 RepID=A0A7Z0GND8_9MICC|nr:MULTISPECIES: putative quinol monooxygenase [Nesterenkonia]MDZ5077706.1 antibiotic biosynthesis monooxygenase [Nesterenkonia sp. HG001]NYJ78669.1 quinol monooxygenase YgiN [Nesterenkonia xinjiangensis]